jgi:UDP:flavonoid glycosyltransferase YjiC (YdhE family)
LQPIKKKVIVCPLDWGLGHSSRMIAIIHRYLKSDYQVILGGSGKSGDLLKVSFPDLPFISMPSFVVRYCGSGKWLAPWLFFQLPAMILSFFREHRLIRNIVKYHHVDVVVSDNRYGLFCKQAHCIFVTHQISPLLPPLWYWAEYPVYRLIRKLIHQFNECWVPDIPDQKMSLSGKLSHRFRLPRNASYVGILSRFETMPAVSLPESQEKYELVFVLSGPEPQLGLFFKISLTLALRLHKKTMIIAGFHEGCSSSGLAEDGMVTVVPHLNASHFKQVLLQARAIICRSGYSGIMDLVTLGKTALLVPTPGQPEQEYLAEHLSRQGYFSRVHQDELDENRLMKYIGEQPAVK